jgi:hypothetical protein
VFSMPKVSVATCTLVDDCTDPLDNCVAVASEDLANRAKGAPEAH